MFFVYDVPRATLVASNVLSQLHWRTSRVLSESKLNCAASSTAPGGVDWLFLTSLFLTRDSDALRLTDFSTHFRRFSAIAAGPAKCVQFLTFAPFSWHLSCPHLPCKPDE